MNGPQSTIRPIVFLWRRTAVGQLVLLPVLRRGARRQRTVQDCRFQYAATSPASGCGLLSEILPLSAIGWLSWEIPPATLEMKEVQSLGASSNLDLTTVSVHPGRRNRASYPKNSKADGKTALYVAPPRYIQHQAGSP